MGRAIAKRFLDEGATVVLFDVDETVERTAVGLDPSGTRAVAVVGDVADRAAVRGAVEAALERSGHLDVLVSQAGIADLEPLLEVADSSWQRMLDVNLTGAFIAVQEAARAMAERRGGAVVVTSSTNAWFVEAHTAPYSATKAALVGFVRAAALDLAPYRIRINSVSPGIIRTRLSAPLTNDQHAAREYLKRVPLQRFGEPHEVADAVAFLASSQSTYITGENLVVDGGASLGVTLEIGDQFSSGPIHKAFEPGG
jgi:3-oxoacyl-[acyl-carrier protein] reductase